MTTIRAPAGVEEAEDWIFNLTGPVFFVYGSCFDSVFLAHADEEVLRVGGKLEIGDLVREGEDLDICELRCIFDLNFREDLKVLR